jgi:ubiquinone biosynthesis protein UbiJ
MMASGDASSSAAKSRPDASPGASSSRELLASLQEEVTTLRSTVAALESRITQLESFRSSWPLPGTESME